MDTAAVAMKAHLDHMKPQPRKEPPMKTEQIEWRRGRDSEEKGRELLAPLKAGDKLGRIEWRGWIREDAELEDSGSELWIGSAQVRRARSGSVGLEVDAFTVSRVVREVSATDAIEASKRLASGFSKEDDAAKVLEFDWDSLVACQRLTAEQLAALDQVPDGMELLTIDCEGVARTTAGARSPHDVKSWTEAYDLQSALLIPKAALS